VLDGAAAVLGWAVAGSACRRECAGRATRGKAGWLIGHEHPRRGRGSPDASERSERVVRQFFPTFLQAGVPAARLRRARKPPAV